MAKQPPEKLSRDKVTLKIPRPLYHRLQTIIAGSGFRSVNGFIVYLLRDLLALRGGDEQNLTDSEVAILKKRLKKLGYL